MTFSSKFKLLICSFLFLASSALHAALPTRVIRLADLTGEVSFLPAGEKRWAPAIRNRTLYIGDSLWNDVDSLSMLELGGSKLCIGSDTNIKILNLKSNLVQVQLTQGSALLYIKHLKKNQEIEINTPNLAFVVKNPGVYRLSVASDGSATVVRVKQGQATIYGVKKSFFMGKNQSAKFKGTNLTRTAVGKPTVDPLEKWCNKHTVEPKKRVTIRYVSEDVIGYDDLDAYGSWREVRGYGYVWTPTEVRQGWSPYRDGRWLWIEPWGWTWVGDEPWGYTPYHYGRWVFVEHHWYWVPSPKKARVVYKPALVVFANIGQDNVSWFPLGPGEVYHQHRKVQYKNHNATAVTTVPQKVFLQAKPTQPSHIVIKQEDIKKAPISNTVAIKPQVQSVLGTDQEAKAKPAEKVTQVETIAVTKAPEENKDKTENIKVIEVEKPISLPEPTKEESAQEVPEPLEQTVQEQPVKAPEVEQSAPSKPAVEEKPEQPVQEQQAEEKPQPVQEKQVEEKPEQPAQEQQAEEKPQPVQEKQAEEKPQPAQEQQAEEKPQPALEKQVEEKLQPQQEKQEEAAQQAQEQQRAQEAARQREEQQRAKEEAQERAQEQKRAQEEAQERAQEQQRAKEEAQERAQEQQRAKEEAQERAQEQHRAKEEAQERAQEQQRAQEEARQRAQEQQRAQEEARQRAQEQQRAQEEARERAQEQQRAQEEARQRAQEEQQRAQEEARQRAEEQQRAQEEARQRAEEQQRAQEEARLRAQEEAARKAAQESAPQQSE